MLKRSLRPETKNKAARRKGVPPFSVRHNRQAGSVLFYVFIAIGLLGALTLSFVDTSRESAVTQRAQRMTEEIYSQANAIRGAVLECVHLYPGGGGDLNEDGVIDDTDNPNSPYPLTPTVAHNPGGAAPNNGVGHLKCPGAPTDAEAIYDGTGTTGRYLPRPPNGFSEWTYANDTAQGVRISMVADGNDAAVGIAVDRLLARFATCEAYYESNNFGVYLKRNSTCP